MTVKTFVCAVTVITASALPSTAMAQTLPDITDAINQNTRIEDARRVQEGTNIRPEVQDGSEIDGEAGIYVLTVNEIFYVASGVGGGWSENPLRTVDDVGSSGFADAVITAGVQTKIAETLDFGVATSVSGIEYFEDFAPSSRTANASMNVGMPIEGTPIYVGVSAFGGRNFDSNFENGTWFYGANAQVSAGGSIGPDTLVRGTLSGGRNLNDIEENNNWNASLGFELTQVISQEFSVSTQARVTRTWFDDFFEDVTFAPRNDWQYGGSINANWVPIRWLAVTGSVGYEDRDSDFFLSSYNGFEASISITARERF